MDCTANQFGHLVHRSIACPLQDPNLLKFGSCTWHTENRDHPCLGHGMCFLLFFEMLARSTVQHSTYHWSDAISQCVSPLFGKWIIRHCNWNGHLSRNASCSFGGVNCTNSSHCDWQKGFRTSQNCHEFLHCRIQFLRITPVSSMASSSRCFARLVELRGCLRPCVAISAKLGTLYHLLLHGCLTPLIPWEICSWRIRE